MSPAAAKHSTTVLGGQHPIGFWPEIFYLFIPGDNHGKGGGLNTANAEGLLITSIF